MSFVEELRHFKLLLEAQYMNVVFIKLGFYRKMLFLLREVYQTIFILNMLLLDGDTFENTNLKINVLI